MFYRFDDDDDLGLNVMPACPYCQYLYRQFPPAPPFGGYPPAGGASPLGGMGGQQKFGPPSGPPPTKVPVKTQAQAGIKAVSPGSIRPCTFRYVYIWLDNGRSFWAWLTRVDRISASGWRWNGRRWVYFGVDLRRIDSFECY